MRARGRRLQRGDGAHQRRLARAVGAEQAEHAARDRQADVVERHRAIGIGVRQIGDFEHVIPPDNFLAGGVAALIQADNARSTSGGIIFLGQRARLPCRTAASAVNRPHDLDQRHPPRLPRLFRRAGPCARAVGAAGAAQRPDPDVRQRRDGAVQERLHRPGNAALCRPRLSSQKCVRAGGKHNDLDNVGYTARHHTFFEMLGNFSFGDYFKDQAITHAWTLLTKEWGLDARPADRHRLSHRRRGVRPVEEDRRPARRAASSASPTKDNFWAMGADGPCGPCSEIFYDHGDHIPGGPPGSPDEDGDRFVEIWNLVFMQYLQENDEIVADLPKPSIDTGMGLERVAAVHAGRPRQL